MTIQYRKTKTLCTPSKLPASDYVINPYVGCTHRCRYCYAAFMGRFTGHSEPWGTYLEPREYESMRLPRDLRGKTILVGSVTDAYNPSEAHFRLMPPILRVLAGCEAHVEILTKSDLVLRDVDLIRAIPDVSVGVSLSNLDQRDNDELEPGASSAEARLNALRVLHEAGVRTYLFVAPYLPGLSDLKQLFAATRGSVDLVCVENLNLRGAAKKDVLDRIAALHPQLSDLYSGIYMGRDGPAYWKKLEEEIETLRHSLDVPLVSYMYHEKIRKGGTKK